MTYQIYIYTLALKDGYYYVGKTIDPDRRFNEHFSCIFRSIPVHIPVAYKA